MSTVAAHTAGPWARYEQDHFVIVTPDGRSIADAAPGFPCDIREADANANLIAAAPDMLQALQFIVSQIDEPRNAIHDFAAYRHGSGMAMARRAVEKAMEPKP